MFKRLSPSACASLALFALCLAAPAQAQTQLAWNSSTGGRSRPAGRTATRAPLRRLTPVRASGTDAGARVTVSSDSPLDDYAAFRQGERFVVVIPRAELSATQAAVEGRGFADARLERRGEDVLLSFRLEPGTAARAVQRFNRLELFFEAHAQQQTPPASAQSGGTA
ncbi:MAG TPA: hypothetical protein VGV38_23390, partial [Pyrinomonadaceae bacterium]|nr:hypothetical protein [Pyrinomonadaceae bacterium]